MSVRRSVVRGSGWSRPALWGFMLLCAAMLPGGAQGQALISRGADWRYLDTGVDLGLTWRDAGFDDTAWASGPAELGYGDGGEATVVGYGADPNNKYVTTYFRHAFDVPDPTIYMGSLRLDVLYDDGVVVFMNGVEVGRPNMPGTPGLDDFDYVTFASGVIEETWAALAVDPAILVTGRNVVAVEVHQATLTSSDISFDLDLLPPGAALMRKGPYLLYGGNNQEMMVRWQVGAAETCTIEWGTDTTCSGGAASTNELGADHQHEFVIPGLTPGRHYYYRVTDPLTGSFTGDFLAGPPALASSLSFFAIGDTRSDPDTFDSVCAGMAAAYGAEPDFQTLTLHSGDWVFGDTEAYWDSQFFPPFAANARTLMSHIPIQGCMGNHEGPGVWFQSYWPYPFMADRYWSFDYGPIHVAVIDQFVAFGAGSAQYTWLENDLAQSASCFKILLLHRPGWSAGGSHGNDATVQTDLQPLCERYGVPVVVAGHNHYYARAEVNGIEHLTVGGGGAPPSTCDPGFPNVVTCANVYHHGEFEIQDGVLRFRAVDLTGAEIDSFTLTCASDVDMGSRALVGDTCAFGGAGAGNGEVDPGEVAALSVTLNNPGRERATAVRAVLTSTTPGVSFSPGRDTSTFPDLDPLQGSAGDSSFVFSVDAAQVACGASLEFQLEVTYTTSLGVRAELESFSITVADPCLVCAAPIPEVDTVALVGDSCATGGGNMNGGIDPGEHAVIRVTLANHGPTDATNITATVTSPSVTVTQPSATLALLRAGGTADLAPGFELDVDPAEPCGSILTFDVDLVYDQGTSRVTFSLAVADPCTPCPVVGCALGMPERIVDFFVTRTATDVELHWTHDTRAEGGYNLYMSDIKADIPRLRLENPPPIPDPFLSVPASPAFPVMYADGLAQGFLYYHVLGVCSDGATEGPN